MCDAQYTTLKLKHVNCENSGQVFLFSDNNLWWRYVWRGRVKKIVELIEFSYNPAIPL